ncbi:hypothetical protein GCM10020367_53000 [Streptomyces sannanensis]|uniref:Sugar kinase n=1 Tax=Streptomyces sannanensis TaxID=285536 RepID=A0ABP6SIC7_9ACTN
MKTTVERPNVPQTPSPGHGNPPVEDRRHMIRRRWLTALVIVLLIGIPAGYLVISAEQSRDSGRVKAAKVATDGLQDGKPSKVQRSIYEVPLPKGAEDVAYYETNNWKVSRLHMRFRTTESGLSWFLHEVGTSPAALEPGRVTIASADAQTVRWTFGPDRAWAGTTHRQPAPRPNQDITVDLTDPSAPVVYVVSTATP